jgi:hypothetical protein
MEVHGHTFIFLADIEIFKPGVLTGWERLAYDQFPYSLLGGGKQGDSAVYCKITAQLTDADKDLAVQHGEPGKDWISPVGWLHTGEESCKAWLARAEDGTVTVDMEAAHRLWGLRNDRELSPDDNAAAAAAAAVLAIVEASQSGKLKLKV